MGHFDHRKRHAFLWFPKKIRREWRWLTWARWEELRFGCDIFGRMSHGRWEGNWWLDTETGEFRPWSEDQYRL